MVGTATDRMGGFLGVEGVTALKMTPWHLTTCWEDGGNLPEKPAAERSSAVRRQEADLLPLMSSQPQEGGERAVCCEHGWEAAE